MRELSVVVLACTLLVGCVSQSKYAQLETQLAQCRGKKVGGGGGGAGGEARRTALLDQLKPLVDRGVLEVEDYDGRTVLGMRSEVLFGSGSAELSPDGRATLREVAKALAGQENTRWQIEGHTDNDPMQGAVTNWELGANRALAVLHVMVESGMPPGRLSAATFGEYAPVAKNDKAEGKAKNRRIEIVLLRDFRAAKVLE
jgi:chemotaxis protein MotB